MKTLEDLRDFINNNEDWNLKVNEAIEANGFIDEAGDTYWICSIGTRRLQFNASMEAEIVDIPRYLVRYLDPTEVADIEDFDTLEEAKAFINKLVSGKERYNHHDNASGCTHFWYEICDRETRTADNRCGDTIWGGEEHSFYVK